MSNYPDAMPYETFIRRALNCDRDKKGASVDYLLNLQRTESGVSLYGLGSAEKQLTAIKGYLTKAVEAFIKPKRGRKLKPEEVAQMESLLPLIERAYSSADLFPIIQRGLDITHPYKGE